MNPSVLRNQQTDAISGYTVNIKEAVAASIPAIAENEQTAEDIARGM